MPGLATGSTGIHGEGFTSPQSVAQFFLPNRAPPEYGTDAKVPRSSAAGSSSSSKSGRGKGSNAKSASLDATAAALGAIAPYAQGGRGTWATQRDPPLRFSQPLWQDWEDTMLVFVYVWQGPNYSLMAKALGNWYASIVCAYTGGRAGGRAGRCIERCACAALVAWTLNHWTVFYFLLVSLGGLARLYTERHAIASDA